MKFALSYIYLITYILFLFSRVQANHYDPKFDYEVVFRTKGPLGMAFKPHAGGGIGKMNTQHFYDNMRYKFKLVIGVF